MGNLKHLETPQTRELWRQFTPQMPHIGTVIGTYGAVPFVHLHLELAACNRMPVLVHDDASPEADELAALCSHYGAAFVCSKERSGHFVGDQKVFARGLEWAQEQSIDWLVKFSRRFIPLYDFTLELVRNAHSYPYPTQSSYHNNSGYEFGFLTEALALHVGAWTAPLEVHNQRSALDLMREREGDTSGGLVEVWMHHRAREVCHAVVSGEVEVADLCPETLGRVMIEEGRQWRWDSYAFWPITGGNRCRSTAGALWHSHPHASLRYELLARALGLSYTERDFDAHQTQNET
jgi:hypothetical protein